MSENIGQRRLALLAVSATVIFFIHFLDQISNICTFPMRPVDYSTKLLDYFKAKTVYFTCFTLQAKMNVYVDSMGVHSPYCLRPLSCPSWRRTSQIGSILLLIYRRF